MNSTELKANALKVLGDLEEIPTPLELPAEVKSSMFGCQNCLHASIECRLGSWYEPHTVRSRGGGRKERDFASCKNYTYYG